MRNTMTTSTVARLLGVAVGSVSRWIDEGQLKAGKTPGGHRRISRGDLVDFLKRQNLPIPDELADRKTGILVVDDEPSVADWLAGEITEMRPDAKLHAAYDGFAAGELVASESPDVVLLDLRMPGMDGFEVCRRIKSRPGGRRVRVIAMTAHHSEEAESAIRDAGADAYLVKPIELDTLADALDDALREGAAIRG